MNFRKSTALKRTPYASHSNHPECSDGRGENVAADLESIDIWMINLYSLIKIISARNQDIIGCFSPGEYLFIYLVFEIFLYVILTSSTTYVSYP
jgi:hypothetical protein